MHDHSEGIYDDGEWISWDWINGQLLRQDLQEQYPNTNPEMAQIFESLVDLAQEYHQRTGRYLQIWGELGELYAEVKFGLQRHRPHEPGSDGRLGNDFVEVKTISPEKGAHKVHVKRAGNFNKLLIVRIKEDFVFEAHLLDRSTIGTGQGKVAKVSWPTRPTKEGENT